MEIIYVLLTIFFAGNLALDYWKNIDAMEEWSVELKATMALITFLLLVIFWPLLVLRMIWNSLKH